MSSSNFLDTLFGKREGYVEVRGMDNDGTVAKRAWFEWPINRTVLLDYVRRMSEHYNLFVGVLLRGEDGKGTAEYVEDETEWLWADVDQKRGMTFGEVLRRIRIEPQVVVDSGHGWHLYWHLDRSVPGELASEAMKELASLLDGDRVGDPARIMRVPGTLNLKDDDVRNVRLLRLDPYTRVRFGDFDLPEPDRRITPWSEEYTSDKWEPSNKDAPRFGEGARNISLTRLAGAMASKGMGYEEMVDALANENELRCDPPLPHREVQNIVRSVTRYR